jgi:hypothetical protein
VYVGDRLPVAIVLPVGVEEGTLRTDQNPSPNSAAARAVCSPNADTQMGGNSSGRVNIRAFSTV